MWLWASGLKDSSQMCPGSEGTAAAAAAYRHPPELTVPQRKWTWWSLNRIWFFFLFFRKNVANSDKETPLTCHLACHTVILEGYVVHY